MEMGEYVTKCMDYTLSELKSYEYAKLTPFRPFKDLELTKLLAYFENNDCFLSLSQETQISIISEVHYRICDKFNTPYFNIRFKTADKLDERCFNCGETVYVQLIIINLYPDKECKRLTKFKRETVGLNYLDTIIHETKHAIQYYYLIEMLKGKNIPQDYAFIAFDTIANNVIDNANIKNFNENPADPFYLSGAEIDARIFANDTLVEWANSGLFQNPNAVKDFAYGGNYIVCSLEYLNNSITTQYFQRLKKVINNLDCFSDLAQFDALKFVTDENKLKEYEEFMLNRENARITDVAKFLNQKLSTLKENEYNAEINLMAKIALEQKHLVEAQTLIEQSIALQNHDYIDLTNFYVLSAKTLQRMNTEEYFLKKLNHYKELYKAERQKKQTKTNTLEK